MAFWARCSSATAIAAVGYSVSSYVENKYPPFEGSNYKFGDIYFTKDGRKRFFVGYTGHHKSTVENIDTNRPLYFASKAAAQWYAERFKQDGAVGHIIAEKMPSYEDYGIPRTATNLLGGGLYGTYAPLSPEGMKRMHVEIIDPEEVTPLNRAGKIAAFRRMLQS